MLSNSSLWTKSIRNLFFVAVIFVLARMCFHAHAPSRKGFPVQQLVRSEGTVGKWRRYVFLLHILSVYFHRRKSQHISVQHNSHPRPSWKIFSCELMLPGLTEMFPSTSTHILSFSIFGNPDVVDKLGHIWHNLALAAYGNIFMSDLGNERAEQYAFGS